ncbi:MAG: 50S ribosomal protein L17 [Oscillospiraceae bacterium]|nr:50S ribosomal protein L17 [Oscillospiraceae bacterium]
MSGYRKLGRSSDQRKAMLRGLVTALLKDGRVETTVTRAKEVSSIVEGLISAAIKENNSFSSKQIKVSKARLDSKGKKYTITKRSKNDRSYFTVEREDTTVMKSVDSPARLHARRRIIPWVYRAKDEKGKPLNLVNKLFDEIAPKFKTVSGGYTRIYRIGQRRGDAAEMAILELID